MSEAKTDIKQSEEWQKAVAYEILDEDVERQQQLKQRPRRHQRRLPGLEHRGLLGCRALADRHRPRARGQLNHAVRHIRQLRPRRGLARARAG